MMNLPEIPLINRAKGFHLYEDTGRRYLDFYQDNGRAVLGHRPNNLSSHLKNVLSKGLLAETPSKYAYRLGKAMKSLLPEYPHARVYEHRLKTERVLSAAGLLPPDTPVPDILFPSGRETARAVLWRPFLEDTAVFPEIVVPLLPFPGGFAPSVICFREGPGPLFPPSDACSPFLLAGLTRIVYDLLREIQERDREGWSSFEKPGWERTGPYLLPPRDGAGPLELFKRCLREGVFLNPSPEGPNIIPGEYSSGELACFLRRC